MAEPVPTIRLLYGAGAVIGESPAWHQERVHWTDPVSRRLLSYEQNGRFRATDVTSSIWSLALRDGALVGALDDRFCSIGEAGEINAGAAARVDPGCRFNDMTVDARGGLWVGMMHRGILSTRGGIFHAPSLHEPPKRVASGLGVPNGMKLSADGRTLFVIDTLDRTLLAYPVDGGSLGEPVIVSDFLDLRGKPDGMTLAADGSFWVAMWGGGGIVQLDASGAFVRHIAVPAPHVSSVCFTGENRLLVTTSRMRLSSQALRDHPDSGGLFEVLLAPGG